MSGEWVSVNLPNGSIRQDWVPDDQPDSPDGAPGLWHVVTESEGSHRWEWHERKPPPLPPAPPPSAVRLEPQFGPGPSFPAFGPTLAAPARYIPPAARPPRRYWPSWRKGTWVVLAFNLLMFVWVLAGASTAAGQDGDCQYLSRETCNDANDVGAAIGVTLLVILWTVGDVILGVVWMVTNKSKTRDCPACGADVKKGFFACMRCGYDFRGALRL